MADNAADNAHDAATKTLATFYRLGWNDRAAGHIKREKHVMTTGPEFDTYCQGYDDYILSEQ